MLEQDIYISEENIYVTFVEISTTPINITVAESESLNFQVTDIGINGASGISGYSGAAGGGSSGISGPATSTDNAIARWDGTGGDALKDSSVLIDDNDGVYAKEFVTVNDGSVTRVDGYISQIAIVSGRTINITRVNGYISSITDGTRTWTYTRDGNNNIISWTVT